MYMYLAIVANYNVYYLPKQITQTPQRKQKVVTSCTSVIMVNGSKALHNISTMEDRVIYGFGLLNAGISNKIRRVVLT